jgi:hypothetical protein
VILLSCDGKQAVTQSRICADAHLQLTGYLVLQRKRAAPVFVTGWKPRESLSAPVAETFPMAPAVQKITLSSSRHPLQQACSVPIERPAREGRRLDRRARRGHRPAHAPARPQCPTGSGRQRRGDRHVRGPETAPTEFVLVGGVHTKLRHDPPAAKTLFTAGPDRT